MSIDNGGPAFPCEREHGERLDSAEGMTLRDYFAAKAMSGFVVGASGMGNLSKAEVFEQFYRVAEYSYWMAEAMLKARKA